MIMVNYYEEGDLMNKKEILYKIEDLKARIMYDYNMI